MTISKHIMNPSRIAQLKIIAEQDKEVNDMYLANKSHKRIEQVRLSIERFAELKLITFTSGGYFTLSDKGKQYLETLN